MAHYIQHGKMEVDSELFEFVNREALPGTQVEQQDFWSSFESVLEELIPENKALLAKRDDFQAKLDEYHTNTAYQPAAYKEYLKSIGYLVDEPESFKIDTSNVDPEIATMAGPQLVVPINNARYALNAANARWGSLYDALYGTDVIPKADDLKPGYDPERGAQVIDYAKNWLDENFPLASGSHKDVAAYQIVDDGLKAKLADGSETSLANSEQLSGFDGDKAAPTGVLLNHNGLHIEIQIDAAHPIGKTDPAQVKDILVEAALSTIMDCEDSVAAVDAEDKVLVYRNWLGLMQGTLTTDLQKGGKTVTRSMSPDRQYQTLSGDHLTLPGRSLMFVRNVGHLMDNPAIRFSGDSIPEGVMDAMITCLIAKHDLLHNSKFTNSKTGSIYIVKPKMHGPEEVAFSNKLFGKVEDALGLQKNTVKMGIMDEERRTSVNLKACIAEAKSRTAFINTGFLDRTGDEIHTSMALDAFAPKADLKAMPWIKAYETSNVKVGIDCGLSGKAQIGKGMWPEPDNMAKMMETKLAHPKAAANTAWVPSPTAATLHAMHYHQVDVLSLQQSMTDLVNRELDDILTIPLKPESLQLTEAQVQHELDNNVQGILGYVVRWVHQGVGCSKVPDLNDVGLMEDRATLRISSQHIANWLKHGLVSKPQVEASLEKMARLVDEQNAGDAEYINMAPDYANSVAYQAACELIFDGEQQPNGYTEPVLHKKRLEMKQKLAS